MQLSLTTDTLNKIKLNIQQLATTYQTKSIDIEQVGYVPLGRKLIESISWPISEALKYFELEGAIRITGTKFEILKDDYFAINLNGLSLPVSFSIDKRIESDLIVMTSLYALIYDVENRLRFFISDYLGKIHGDNYLTVLPKVVREKISSEKAKVRIYVIDPRNKELEFIDFVDLKRIIQSVDIKINSTDKQTLIDKLEYLNEARLLIAHNNIIVSEEIEKVKQYCDTVKRILESCSY